MAISVVGTPTSQASLNGADVTLTLPTLQQDDIVILFGGFTFRSGASLGPSTAGYTTVYSQNSSSTILSFGVWYKKMGATPDTSVTGLGTANAADGVAYGFVCLRGVDTTTPQDAAATNAASLNPASITTVTDSSFVLVCTGIAATDSTPGTISSFTLAGNTNANDTTDVSIAAAYLPNPVAGVIDPGAWSAFTNTSPISVTTAWRPAAAVPNTGTASGSYDFSGSATGEAPPNDGTATGGYDFTGSSTGSRSSRGSSTGAYDFTGSAVGKSPNHGTASGAYDFSGTAVGDTPANDGTASGAYAFNGSAAGTATHQGSSAGTYDESGSSVGAAPAWKPKNLVATAISDDRIDLTWDALAYSTAYDIERNGVIVAFNVATNSYSDTGLDPTTLYTYRVRAAQD